MEVYPGRAVSLDRLVKFYLFRNINEAIADAKRGDTVKPVLRGALIRVDSRQGEGTPFTLLFPLVQDN
jgi:hypothetical protein